MSLLRRLAEPRVFLQARYDHQQIQRLRDAFRDLQLSQAPGWPASETQWQENLRRLRNLTLERDPRDFLRWDVIRETMFVENARWVVKELEYLREQPDWNERWRDGIRECSTGNPRPFRWYRRSSGNLIHQAYHLAQFEQKTRIRVSDMNSVVEFGGGYGCMCRLFYRLGFRGDYALYDLPGFSALQEFYLASSGVAAGSWESMRSATSTAACIVDQEALKVFVEIDKKRTGRMFIATWSISEAPIDLRDRILSMADAFEAFLITYQAHFGGVDNRAYFHRLIETHPAVQWQEWEVEHLPRNYYLVGRARTEH